jgi:hypothetical protein
MSYCTLLENMDGCGCPRCLADFKRLCDENQALRDALRAIANMWVDEGETKGPVVARKALEALEKP